MLLASWSVLLALAPWLLLGMAIAGALHVLLPRDFVHRHLAGRGGVLKAVLLGVPLPLCSCGVIPAGLGLKKDGASDGAVVGFLISTPQTGVDSILVSASFLGWPFAAFKVAAAAVTGLVGGWLTDAVSPATPLSTEASSGDDRGRRGWREGLDHALDILRTIWGWVVAGVLISAAINAFVPQGFLTGMRELGVLVPALAALAISLPLYVCATASVPVAAALVAGGMPAGAALVFLMAGPATNVATIGAIYRALGRKSLIIYLTTIVLGSMTAGLAFDSVISPAVAAAHLHGEPSWWRVLAAVSLTGLLVYFAFEELRSWLGRRRGGGAAIAVAVEGMTCGGCVSKLERALRSAEGVTAAVVTLEPARAVVSGTLSESRIREIVERTGFRAGARNKLATRLP